jgi:hypothetical protein
MLYFLLAERDCFRRLNCIRHAKKLAKCKTKNDLTSILWQNSGVGEEVFWQSSRRELEFAGAKNRNFVGLVVSEELSRRSA